MLADETRRRLSKSHGIRGGILSAESRIEFILRVSLYHSIPQVLHVSLDTEVIPSPCPQHQLRVVGIEDAQGAFSLKVTDILKLPVDNMKRVNTGNLSVWAEEKEVPLFYVGILPPQAHLVVRYAARKKRAAQETDYIKAQTRPPHEGAGGFIAFHSIRVLTE